MSQSSPLASTDLESAAPARASWHIVGMLVAYSFMTWFNRVSMSVAYDEQIKAESGIAPEDMGFVYSSFLFFYMLCMTPGGWLIDKYGPWKALVVMGLGSALFGMLTGTAGLPAIVAAGLLLPALLVIRSLMGILTAPVYPACSRVVAHWVPLTQRARANGFIQGAAGVGIACAFPVFGTMLDWMHWHIAFLVTGIVTAVVAITWMAFGANDPRKQLVSESRRQRRYDDSEVASPPSTDAAVTGITAGPPPQPAVLGDTGITAERPRVPAIQRISHDGSWWTLLGNRSLMLLTLSYAAVGYVEYLFYFWMHYYFEDVLKFGKNESRFYAAIMTLSMAVGMVLGGWIADRLRSTYGGKGVALVPALGLCAGGALLLLGVLAQDTVWIVTWLALALGAVGATEAPVWTMAIELGKRYGGTAAAICNTGGNAGGLLAPIVTPFLSAWIIRHYDVSEQASWQWAISLGSLIAVLGAVLWFWITPEDSGHQLVPEGNAAPEG